MRTLGEILLVFSGAAAVYHLGAGLLVFVAAWIALTVYETDRRARAERNDLFASL